MKTLEDGFVVWQHRDGRVDCVGHFAERDLADAYASYLNKRHTARWYESAPASTAVVES